MKKLFKAAMITIAVVILVCVTTIALYLSGNWFAEKKARAFCDGIEVGSSISTAIEKAKAEHVLWGKYRFHNFLFPGSFFDDAVCQVDVDQNGMVVGKAVSMNYD